LAFCQNTSIRTPNTAQLKESPRYQKAGIPTIGPDIAQTTPINTATIPENGTSTLYFRGFSAKIMKNTPMPIYVADIVRIAYIIKGESGNVSIPKKPAIDSHAETGKNNPTTASRHTIPVIHRQIFNPRICISFQITFPYLIVCKAILHLAFVFDIDEYTGDLPLFSFFPAEGCVFFLTDSGGFG